MSVLTFPYDGHYQPPMPVVDVELGAPGRAPLPHPLSALVDSGSDGTLIPIDVLEKAGARCVGEARLRGMNGKSVGERLPGQLARGNVPGAWSSCSGCSRAVRGDFGPQCAQSFGDHVERPGGCD